MTYVSKPDDDDPEHGCPSTRRDILGALAATGIAGAMAMTPDAAAGATLAENAALTPDQALAEIMAGNARFVAGAPVDHPRQSRRGSVADRGRAVLRRLARAGGNGVR